RLSRGFRMRTPMSWVRQRVDRISLAMLLSLSVLIDPATAAFDGDLDAHAKVRQLFDVRTTMRDGIELSADVWLPLASGRYPVILVRTPYLKTEGLKRFP